MSQKRVCLGKVASVHGVKGLVKILPYGEDPSLIESLGPAYTSKDAQSTLLVSLKNQSGKYILASIEGISSREDAEQLRGTELWYDRETMPEPEDGAIYFDDLIGLIAIEDGADVGEVVDVQDFGAGPLLDIKTSQGLQFFVPYHGNYVEGVDLDEGVIALNNHEDLLFD